MATAVGALKVNLFAETGAFVRDMGKANRAVTSGSARMNKSLVRANRQLTLGAKKAQRFAKSMLPLKSMLAGIAAGGLLVMTKQAIEAADTIGKVADKVGFGVEALQELRFAAEQTDVDVKGVGAADLLKAAGLYEAQQLGLKADVHLADFVEEKRAAVGQCRRSLTVGDGAGEGALDVPENLAFHQLLGDGGAVEGDERLAVSRAALVERLGADILAGAGLAGDEHGGLAGRGAVDDPVYPLHGKRRADEAAELAAAEVFLEGLGQMLTFEGVAQGVDKAVGVERLDDEVEGPLLHRLHRYVDGAVGGDHHHGSRHSPLVYMAQYVEAVHVGQLEIEDNRLGQALADGRERLSAGLHVGDEIGLVAQVLPARQRRGVLDQQNVLLFRRRHHASPKHRTRGFLSLFSIMTWLR